MGWDNDGGDSGGFAWRKLGYAWRKLGWMCKYLQRICANQREQILTSSGMRGFDVGTLKSDGGGSMARNSTRRRL